jgi:hypothetical protein
MKRQIFLVVEIYYGYETGKQEEAAYLPRNAFNRKADAQSEADRLNKHWNSKAFRVEPIWFYDL